MSCKYALELSNFDFVHYLDLNDTFCIRIKYLYSCDLADRKVNRNFSSLALVFEKCLTDA